MDNIIFSHYLVTLVFFLVPGYIFVRGSRYILSYYKRTLPEIVILSIIWSLFIHIFSVAVLNNFPQFSTIYMSIMSKADANNINVLANNILSAPFLILMLCHFLFSPIIFLILYFILSRILIMINYLPKAEGDVKHLTKILDEHIRQAVITFKKQDSNAILGEIIQIDYKNKIITFVPFKFINHDKSNAIKDIALTPDDYPLTTSVMFIRHEDILHIRALKDSGPNYIERQK